MAAKRSGGRGVEPAAGQVPDRRSAVVDEELSRLEIRALVDEELSRLPDKYRIAVVLCDLEGRSRPAVAQQLRLPEGTVASRLARGRAMLAKRLARRGVGVSATALAAALPQQAASGSVPAALLANTIKVTTPLAAGEVTAAGAISAQVSALTEGALKAMTLAKQKAAGVVLLMATLVVSGGMITYHALGSQSIEPGDRTPDTNAIAAGNRNGTEAPVVNPEADIKKYGSEADARRHAEEMVRRNLGAIPGMPELEQWCLQFLNEPGAKPNAARLPRSGSLEAKLDRAGGQWTVTGVHYFGDAKAAWETDWKAVVQYTVLPDPIDERGPPEHDPAVDRTSAKGGERTAGSHPLPHPVPLQGPAVVKSRPHEVETPSRPLEGTPTGPTWGWKGAAFGWFAPKGERLPNLREALMDPHRYGLRAVGMTAAKRGER